MIKTTSLVSGFCLFFRKNMTSIVERVAKKKANSENTDVSKSE